MSTDMNMTSYETKFIGRKEILEDLDKAWRGNTRIFGIFGLRAVGKTRTAFEFIHRQIREAQGEQRTECASDVVSGSVNDSYASCSERNQRLDGTVDATDEITFCNQEGKSNIVKGSVNDNVAECTERDQKVQENVDDSKDITVRYLEGKSDIVKGSVNDSITGSTKGNQKLDETIGDAKEIAIYNLECKSCIVKGSANDYVADITEKNQTFDGMVADTNEITVGNLEGNRVNDRANDSVAESTEMNQTLDGMTDEMKKTTINDKQNTFPFGLVYVDLHRFKDFGSFSSQVFAQFGMQPRVKNVNEFVVQLVPVINKSPKSITVLFFDNAEDAIEGRLEYSLQDISSRLVQNCKSVRTILTATTNARFAQVGRVYKRFELEPMLEVDASKLMRNLTRNVNFQGTFDRIVSLCAGLPLAIMLVAAELMTGTSPIEMVELLAECRIKALSKPGIPDDKKMADVYKKFIERLSQVFRDRMTVLSYIPGSFNVWEAKEMLGHETLAVAKQETVLPLRVRNFLQKAPSYTTDVDERRFDIHGVIRECLSLFFEIKNMPEIRKLYCKTFVTVMKDISRQMGSREYAVAILRFTVEHPNLQQLLTDVFYSTEDTYHFYMEVVASCSDMIEKFMTSQGEQFYRACLNLATNSGRAKDIITVKIALGSMQTNAKGEFSSGLHSYQEALNLAEKFPPSRTIATVYRKLGFNMYLQGWGEDGLSYLRRSLEITSRLGHQDTEDFLSTMASLGIVYSFLGRFEEAERCHLAILKRRKALQGEDHPAIGKQLNNLGIMYEQKGDIEKARRYFEEGLAKKKATKTEPVSLVNSLSNVARQCADLGDFDKAEALLNEALALLEEKNVNNISAIGLINNSFGKVYLKKGDFKSSVKHMKESIRIKRTTMQSESTPFFVNPLILLARGYIGCENYGAAINRLNQVLALKDALTEKSPHNDLVCQCYEELLRVHSVLKNDKLIAETKTEMGAELFRLAKYFESKGSETKANQFWQKLEALD